MKLRRNLAITIVVIMLSIVTTPVLADSDANTENWYSWILSLFNGSENSVADASGSGLGKPPPK